MMQCVDLAKTQKPNKSKPAKGTDLPPPVYYYHEASVHDIALRNYLLEGYESFKVREVLKTRHVYSLKAEYSFYMGLTPP